MFERFSRSWNLVKASASVLRSDKELLLFPVMSTGAVLLVMACFALPVIGLGALDGMSGGENKGVSAAAYIVGFLFYVTQYFVMFFFNSALVGAALMRLEGKDPTVKDGINIAMSKLGVILAYAAIAATVGMILRAIQERVGFVGKIIVGLLGVGWSIATFLVVPVLVTRDVGPIDAIKESASLLKKTWGENLIGQGGIGLAFGFIMVGVVMASIFLVIIMAMTGSMFLIGTAIVVAILAVALTALIQAALSGIYSAALYRYATEGEGSTGFEAETLKLAFAPK
jgi:hypothetical protein